MNANTMVEVACVALTMIGLALPPGMLVVGPIVFGQCVQLLVIGFFRVFPFLVVHLLRSLRLCLGAKVLPIKPSNTRFGRTSNLIRGKRRRHVNSLVKQKLSLSWSSSYFAQRVYSGFSVFFFFFVQAPRWWVCQCLKCACSIQFIQAFYSSPFPFSIGGGGFRWLVLSWQLYHGLNRHFFFFFLG